MTSTSANDVNITTESGNIIVSQNKTILNSPILYITAKANNTYVVQYSVLGYTRKNKGCAYYEYGNYSSLESAISECDTDSKCWGVFDAGCDGRVFSLCPLEGVTYSSSSSCIYFKPGNKFTIILKYR